jgi:hypothetical protein
LIELEGLVAAVSGHGFVGGHGTVGSDVARSNSDLGIAEDKALQKIL